MDRFYDGTHPAKTAMMLAAGVGDLIAARLSAEQRFEVSRTIRQWINDAEKDGREVKLPSDPWALGILRMMSNGRLLVARDRPSQPTQPRQTSPTSTNWLQSWISSCGTLDGVEIYSDLLLSEALGALAGKTADEREKDRHDAFMKKMLDRDRKR
ncbi:MAG TPA: hypothetical protein VHE78_05855 [Gemmatimonadaceae bacterium]|nr:hypothetical protein [Gemmatimonadaceae bacterium]